MTLSEREAELHRLVGEIHADVRTLVAKDISNTKRLNALEHRTYIGGAVLATLLAIKDPTNWVTWLNLIKG